MSAADAIPRTCGRAPTHHLALSTAILSSNQSHSVGNLVSLRRQDDSLHLYPFGCALLYVTARNARNAAHLNPDPLAQASPVRLLFIGPFSVFAKLCNIAVCEQLESHGRAAVCSDMSILQNRTLVAHARGACCSLQVAMVGPHAWRHDACKGDETADPPVGGIHNFIWDSSHIMCHIRPFKPIYFSTRVRN